MNLTTEPVRLLSCRQLLTLMFFDSKTVDCLFHTALCCSWAYGCYRSLVTIWLLCNSVSAVEPLSSEPSMTSRLLTVARSPVRNHADRSMEWQSLLSEYENDMDFNLASKIVNSINDTVHRMRCPLGSWKRIGRLCYSVLDASNDPLPVLVDRCQRLAREGKSTTESMSRASVAVVTDLLELQIIVGYARQVNVTRIQLMLSAKLTETVAGLDHRVDLLSATIRSKLLSGEPYCSSLLLHSPIDLPVRRQSDRMHEFSTSDSDRLTFSKHGKNIDPLPTVENSHCFLLDAMLVSQACGNERACHKCFLYYNANCSLDEPTPYVCKYTNNLCSANPICGPHGRCVDRDGFRCECGLLYGGLLCDKITREGVQIIACMILIVMVMFANSRFGRSCFNVPLMLFIRRNSNTMAQFPLNLDSLKRSLDGLSELWVMINRKLQYFRDWIFFRSPMRPKLKTHFSARNTANTATQDQRTTTMMMKSSKRDRASIWRNSERSKRNFVVACMMLIMVSIVLFFTSALQLIVFKTEYVDGCGLEHHMNRSLSVVKKCQVMSSFVHENLISFPFAASAILIFALFVKRDQYLRRCCGGRLGLPMPLEPFNTRHRFTTAVIFGLLSCEILKIFEELLFKTGSGQPLGILLDLSIRTGFVFLIGMRYYPLLASLQFVNNPVCSGVGCVYALFDAVYVIAKQGLCMGFMPISTTAGLVDEARLRLELGSWYVVYGLIRNTPHFSCVAFICAELCMRFYESLHGKQLTDSHILAGVEHQGNGKTRALTPATLSRMPDTYARCWQEVEESITRYASKPASKVTDTCRPNDTPNIVYVRNLLKRSVWIMRRKQNLIEDQSKPSYLRRTCRRIYQWSDDFRYSTIAVCTFVTSFIFLYYLTCTLLFYHLSRTEGQGFVLNFYFQHILNVRLISASVDQSSAAQTTGSLKLLNNGLVFYREIFLAGFSSFCIFAVQLFQSMKQYRCNKLMMYKGIFEDIPSARHLNPSKVIAQSVHYSGFLIGYMAWGYFIVFYLILFFLCTVTVITRQRIEHLDTVVALVAPVVVIYFLKVLLVRSSSKVMFTQGFGSRMALNNRRTHAVFVYFSFFFDCFLGVIACFARLSKSILLNILFMARLDYSFVGRPLERLDPGFSTYVAFLHTEVAHTHPVMVAFCEIAWRRMILQRMGVVARLDRRSSRREAVRFRWFLAYTLLRNGGLLNFRKNLSFRLQLIVNYRYATRAPEMSEMTNGQSYRYDDFSSHGTHITVPHSSLYGCRFSITNDTATVPPIRIYSTSGIGQLSAGVGERVVEDKFLNASAGYRRKNSDLDEGCDGDLDNTTAMLMSHNVNTVPLVFETAYSDRIPNMEFLSYTMSIGGSSWNADDVTHMELNTLEPTPFLRIASYRERDALWRQGVRERLYSRSKYRYHYGSLNYLPAIKSLDFEQYKHRSDMQGISSRPLSCPLKHTVWGSADGLIESCVMSSQPCSHDNLTIGSKFNNVMQNPSSTMSVAGRVSSRLSNDQTAYKYAARSCLTSGSSNLAVPKVLGCISSPGVHCSVGARGAPSVPHRPRRVPPSPWTTAYLEKP